MELYRLAEAKNNFFFFFPNCLLMEELLVAQ